MRKIALLLVALAAPVLADTAVTIYDTTNTHYYQMRTPPVLGQTYRVIVPLNPGTTGQVLSIVSVSGNVIQTSYTAVSAGVVVWGGITGTLSNQTDLQASLNLIGISTASLQTQINAVVVSTGQIQSAVNAVGIDTGTIQARLVLVGLDTATLKVGLVNVGADTATLRTSVNSIGVDTGTLRSQLNVAGVSTGTLQAQINAVAFDTGTLRTQLNVAGVSTGTLQSGLNAVGLTTATLQTNINAVGLTTATLQANINAVGLTTATLQTNINAVGLTTATLQTNINAVGLATGTLKQFSLAVTTGGPTSYSGVPISSFNTTMTMLFDSATTLGSLLPTNTYFFQLNTASVTLQANAFNGANQLVKTNGSTQLPAISGALVTNLTGSNIVTGIPTGVLPSTVVYTTQASSVTVNSNFGVTGQINSPLTLTSSETVAANFGVSGSVNQSMTHTSSVTVQNNFSVTGQINQPLTVSSSETINNNLGVTGQVNQPMTFSSSATVNNTFGVTQQINMPLTLSSSETVNNNFGVMGQINQPLTVSSSETVSGANGENVVYNLNAGSMTGAGLTSCSAATSAVTWNNSTNLFGCNTITGGGGGSSSLAVTTGTSAGFVGPPVSSPTAIIVFDSNTTNGQLTGSATYFFTLNAASVTLQSNAFNGASQLVKTNGSTQLPAISGALLTNLTGGNITGGIASGVLPSTIVYTTQASSVTINSNFGVTGQINVPTTHTSSVTISGNFGVTGQVNVPMTHTSSVTVASTLGVTGQVNMPLTLTSSETIASNFGVTGQINQPLTLSSSETISGNFGVLGQINSPLTLSSSETVNGNFGVIGQINQPLTLSSSQTVNNNFGVTGQLNQSLTVTSSVTLNNTIIISSNVIMPGATFYQNAGELIGYAKSTTTLLGNVATAAGVYFSSQTSQGTGGKITSNYTTGVTDNVIFASAPAAGLTVTLNYSSNSVIGGSNQVIQITKVDKSTYPVTIKVSQGDLINSTTGTLTLNAVGQTDELIADGNGNWWPHGQGLQVTPIYVGGGESGNSSNVSASSNTIVCPFTITVPVVVTAVRWFEGTNTGGSTATFGIYDQLGNLILSTGPVAAVTFGSNSLATPFTNLSPGQYYMATQLSNVTVAINGIAANGGNGTTWCTSKTGTTMVLPNPYTFGGGNPIAAPFPFLVISGGRTTQ